MKRILYKNNGYTYDQVGNIIEENETSIKFAPNGMKSRIILKENIINLFDAELKKQ